MPSIILSDNGVSSGSAGLKSTAASDGVLVLQTTTSGGTATNAIYVDTSQNVGLGTTSPADILHLSAASPRLTFTSTNNTSGARYNTVGTATAGSHRFQYGGTEVFTIGISGQTVALQNGTVSSGTGIAFPATQSASTDANTLDDYEEGTWTPNLLFGGGATGIAYQTSGRQGTYVKVGRQVTVMCYIYTSSTGSDTGNMTITGLPFSAMPSSTYYMDYYYPFGARAGYSLPSGGIPMVYLGPSGSQFEFYYTNVTSSGLPTRITKSLVTAGAIEISVEFSYLTSA